MDLLLKLAKEFLIMFVVCIASCCLVYLLMIYLFPETFFKNIFFYMGCLGLLVFLIITAYKFQVDLYGKGIYHGL